MSDNIIKKGQMIVFTHGEYDDYRLGTLAEAVKDFDAEEVAKQFTRVQCEVQLTEINGNLEKFEFKNWQAAYEYVEYLVKQGYIKEMEYKEFNVDDDDSFFNQDIWVEEFIAEKRRNRKKVLYTAEFDQKVVFRTVSNNRIQTMYLKKGDGISGPIDEAIMILLVEKPTELKADDAFKKGELAAGYYYLKLWNEDIVIDLYTGSNFVKYNSGNDILEVLGEVPAYRPKP